MQPEIGAPRYSAQLREIAALDERYRHTLAARLDLNPTSLAAMEWLMREGPLTPTALAGRLEVTPGAVTGVINRLEATGHAHREAAVDARSVRVVPTDASVATANELVQPLIANLLGRTSGYSADEVALIERFLADVAEAYTAGLAHLDR